MVLGTMLCAIAAVAAALFGTVSVDTPNRSDADLAPHTSKDHPSPGRPAVDESGSLFGAVSDLALGERLEGDDCKPPRTRSLAIRGATHVRYLAPAGDRDPVSARRRLASPSRAPPTVA